jgi:hypothetical protein
MEKMRKIARREDAMQRKTADHLVPFLYNRCICQLFKEVLLQELFLDRA